MYIKNSNLSSYKFNQLINEWIYNTPARVCAKKIHLNRNTINFWYNRIRVAVFNLSVPKPFEGEIEIDESYFGEKRPCDHGRGTFDRVAIFGLRERKSGRVWATVVPRTDHICLVPIICERVKFGSTIYSDGFGAYYHLNKFGYKHHVVVHAYTFVTSRVVHTNGIESFWAFAKQLFHGRKGLPRKRYQLHLKEAEFRFNNRDPCVLRLFLQKILNQRG